MKTDTKGNDAGKLNSNLKEILSHHINGCVCDEMYKKRKMTDPNCFWCNDSDEIVLALKEAFELGKLSSPSTEAAAKIQEIIDKIGTYYTDGQRYTKTDAVVDLKKLFQGAAKEQLSEEKVIYILCYNGMEYSIAEIVAKEICALSIPQPTQQVSEIDYKSLLRETAMRCNLAFPANEQDEKWFDEKTYVEESGNFMERLFFALELIEGQELPNNISQPEGAKEEAIEAAPSFWDRIKIILKERENGEITDFCAHSTIMSALKANKIIK